MKTGIELIAEERQRQIEKAGWTLEHDSKHTDESLASAAACYAMPRYVRERYQSYTFNKPPRFFPRWWPESWDLNFWKPSPYRIKELVKAGALIAAEIDRLQSNKQP